MLAAGLVGAACASDEPTGEETTTTVAATTTSTATSAPPDATTTVPSRFGGSAIVGDDQEPESTLNPYAPGGDSLIVRKIGQAIYARGWDFDPTTESIVPDVLLEIPTAANGGVTLNDDGTMTIHYRIRDEAMWSDGTALTGADLAFTIDTLRPLAEPGAFGPTHSVYAAVSGYEVGEKTISVTLDRPTIEYENLFEWILPRHAVEGTDLLTDWNEKPFPGAGPFVFESWEPRSDGVATLPGGVITLVRNPNYWKVDADSGDRLPFLDELVFEAIPETEALLRAFADRELDVIEPPPVWSPVSLDDPDIDLQVVPGPIWDIDFQFGPANRNPASSNHNPAYRRAVAHAIGDSLDDVISWWAPIDSYLDAGVTRLSTGAWGRYGYDQEEARALLEQVKAEEGITTVRAVFSTTSNAEERPRIALALAKALEAVGIDYENQLEDSQLFFQESLPTGTFDMGLWAWVIDPTHSGLVSMLDIFDPGSDPENGSNYARWGTPDSSVRDEFTQRFSEIRVAARSTVDVAEIERLVVEAEQLLADQVVILPLWARSTALAFWADELAGPIHNPTTATAMWNVEDWYRVDR